MLLVYITEGYSNKYVHIRYITQAQLCRIASTKINVFTCSMMSIQCEKTMTAHYYTFTIFCKICRWITCTRLLNLCDAAYVHILVPIYAYTQRCALLGICHESGRCYGQECTSEVLLPRIYVVCLRNLHVYAFIPKACTLLPAICVYTFFLASLKSLEQMHGQQSACAHFVHR